MNAKSFSIDEGMRCAQLLIQRDAGCTAVAAGNDMLAVGCYAALDESGLSCPADLSVVGFNDMPFIDRLRPPLTTIRFPHYQVGTEAAQLLLERIAGHTGPVKVLFLAPELVVRGSTGPPPAPPAPDAAPARARRGRRRARRPRGARRLSRPGRTAEPRGEPGRPRGHRGWPPGYRGWPPDV